ncbi:glutathione S-transferase [Parasphingorhabdus sp.]|uniref:glutathione S-transferase family protein n=1 Tax=Parasphingorhabdus sp. TaxID=2709688 RepID=UPI003266EDB3
MLRITTASLALVAAAFAVPQLAQAQSEPAQIAAMPMPDVTIYHLEGRRSERVVWLMEELGLPYELEYVRGNLAASMAKVHALGHEMPMVPTVVIGDQILVESGAIIETILNRYAPGKLGPARDSEYYPEYLMWMHYAEGSLSARLFSDYRAWRTNPPTVRSRLVDSEAVVQFSENYLAKNPYFGGAEFSAADIMMLFPLNVATGLNLVETKKFPNIAAWKEKMQSRPAYQRMLAAARPDGMIGNLPPISQRPPSERK